MKTEITVFTATYNRKDLLERAYRSLLSQTDLDFEWIVIDDGSNDGTEEALSVWTRKNEESGLFPIRYSHCENGGKMRAHNKALTVASGKLFLTLDSDDYLTDTAIESVKKWAGSIENDRKSFAGVAGLKMNLDGTMIGSSFDGDFIDASVRSREKYGITGDRAEVWFTEVLKRHPFPEIEGESFYSEGVLWLEICETEHLVLRWFNEPLMFCEYQENGYTSKALELQSKNLQGGLIALGKIIKYTEPGFIQKMKLWHRYLVVARMGGKTDHEIYKDLSIPKNIFLLLLIGDRALRILREVVNE